MKNYFTAAHNLMLPHAVKYTDSPQETTNILFEKCHTGDSNEKQHKYYLTQSSTLVIHKKQQIFS